MKNLTGIIVTLALLLVPSVCSQQRQLVQDNPRSEKRIALVIGNGAYVNAPPLKNPVNDAQDMAQALREHGFEVIYKENLNQNDMKRAIREFGATLKNGGIGLFYYAGHGVAVKSINYLVPVDAKVESEEEAEYECVDAGFVLAQMESAGNRLNIVILDACRNNPFARSFRSASRGLAQMDAPSGTLIAYSTAPGSVASDGSARNGLYTQELLKFMRTPNLSIEEVFKQVRISVRNLTQGRQTPWEASSLTGNFYFIASAVNASPVPAIVNNSPTDFELPLAYMGNKTITLNDIDDTRGIGEILKLRRQIAEGERAGSDISKLREQLRSSQKYYVDNAVNRILLDMEARNLGVTVESLGRAEVEAKVVDVPESEVKAFYENNKNKIQGDYISNRSAIKEYLINVQKERLYTQ